MIIKGQTRAADRHWVAHLQRGDHNEEVRVVDSRDLAHVGDIAGSLAEMDAYALGTRCQKPLFDVVARGMGHLTDAQLCRIADLIEAKYPALQNRARMIVGHTKDGDQHGHIAWARCGADGPTVNLPWTSINLMQVAIEAATEFGMELPAGMTAEKDGTPKPERDSPSDISTPLYRQLERMGLPPREFVEQIRAAWGPQFAEKMKAAGWMVAKGDRRGFVLVNHSGEAVGMKQLLPKGTKAKDIEAVLGDPEKARSIEDATKALTPPTLTLAQKFDLAGKDQTPAQVIKLREALKLHTERLDEVKADHHRIQREFEQMAAIAREEHSTMQPGGFSIVQMKKTGMTDGQQKAARIMLSPHEGPFAAIAAARERLRDRQRQERRPLTDEARRLRREIQRETLLEYAARQVRLMREKFEQTMERFGRVRDQILKVKPPRQEQPGHAAQEKVGPFKTTGELFPKREKLFGDDDRQQDTGRERSGPGTGRTPPRRPGPGM